MLDEHEFLGPFGIRTLSRVHLDHPYVLRSGGQEHRVSYLPAESDTGDVWRKFELAGTNPDADERAADPRAPAVLRVLRRQLHDRVPHRIRRHDESLRSRQGDYRTADAHLSPRRTGPPSRVWRHREVPQTDPHWRDHLLFYEYFHGDNGAGLGASHQTGWTGLIATLIQFFWTISARELLEGGAHEVHGKMHGRGHTDVDEQMTA